MYAKPNAKEAQRIDLIARVDYAITMNDTEKLLRLQRECKKIPILSKKISNALTKGKHQ